MAGKLKISYRYSGPDEYENAREPLRDIIKADTGEDFWIETRSYPPMGFPPPLHVESVEKLKKLQGVQISELPGDE